MRLLRQRLRSPNLELKASYRLRVPRNYRARRKRPTQSIPACADVIGVTAVLRRRDEAAILRLALPCQLAHAVVDELQVHYYGKCRRQGIYSIEIVRRWMVQGDCHG